MRRAPSLRLRVILIASALVAAASIVIGLVSVLSLHGYLVDRVDHQVSMAVARAGRIPPPLGGGSGTGSGSGVPNDFVGIPGQPPDTVTAVFTDGRFTVGGWVDSSGTRHELSAAQKERLSDAAHQTEPSTIDLGGSLGQYRVAAGPRSDGTVVVVGAPLNTVNASTDWLALVFTVVGLVAVLLAVLAAALAMGRALRPLRRVSDTAAAVTSMPLDRGEVRMSERVDERDIASTSEVGQVGAALNDLLDHVERALAQREASESTMRRFVADASHELRTPLTVIRAYAQLFTRADIDAAELRDKAMLVESESLRMGALIDELLLLARLDATAQHPEQRSTAPVDLALVVAESVAAARMAGPEHRWVLDLGDRPATVLGSSPELRRVLDNLLTNARLHTPAGTTVSVLLRAAADDGATAASAAGAAAGAEATAGDRAGSAVGAVSDDGPGIPDELLPSVFDRFARGDASRSRDAGGTGLGLSIAQAVAEGHGGTLAARNRGGAATGTGAEFTITLPLAARS